jgi:hypothetical protein
MCPCLVYIVDFALFLQESSLCFGDVTLVFIRVRFVQGSGQLPVVLDVVELSLCFCRFDE